MNLIAIVSNMRLPDILDILFISVVSYHLLLWFWGTKAFKALVGLLLLSGVFTIAESWGLFLTTWVFQIMWQVFVILLIILFQKEIRQMLEKFNPLSGCFWQARPDLFLQKQQEPRHHTALRDRELPGAGFHNAGADLHLLKEEDNRMF